MAQPDLERDVPAAARRKLKEMEAAKSKSKMDYWRLLEPVVKWEDDVAHVKLQCHMGCHLTCTNVSQSADRHFNIVNGILGCKKRRADKDGQTNGALSVLNACIAQISETNKRNSAIKAVKCFVEFNCVCFIVYLRNKHACVITSMVQRVEFNA
jgi:hypothetical protein